jgi:hypothetical protein
MRNKTAPSADRPDVPSDSTDRCEALEAIADALLALARQRLAQQTAERKAATK